MKNVKRGVLHILLVVLAIAALGYIAIVGIGNQHKGTAEHIRLGLDLAGGVSVTYQTEKENPTTREMDDTIYKLQMRVEGLGEEPVVYKEGSNRINVDIPGAKDADEVLEKLGKSGNVLFVDSEKLADYLKNPDAGVHEGAKLAVSEQKLYDADMVICDGSDVDKATAETQTGGTSTDYVVALEFNSQGAKKFAEGTEKVHAKNGSIAVIYDGEVRSNATVDEAITGGQAVIKGQKSYDEANELASTIRIGALPIALKEIRSQVVGAKLGDSAIQSSLLAGVIGLIIIIAFMIAFYRIPGLASSIALIFYVGAISFTLNCFNVTLTLPGIAGILLSIGMAVDANVIIFTRIKEELAEGNSLETSMKNGFAKTLLIGVLLSMFTALFVTRFALNALISLGATDVKFFGKAKKTKKFAFVKNFPKFVAVALVFIAICVGSLIYNKANTGTILNYGLDFKGGTSTSVTFNKDVVADDIKSDVEKLVKDTLSVNPEISEVKGKNTLTIKTTVLDKAQREKFSKAVSEKYNVKEDTIESETISASVSNEMKRDAVMAITVAVILMLLYIAVRFKDITFGASAILALIHDVLIVLMAYGIGSALGIITVGNTFIACMLTILGYSINSTIVTFDRIRENRQAMGKKADLEDIVNTSVSQTITRNINTTLTTFIMIFMLLLLGVSSLREFTIPLIAGLIAGAFSSICLTSAMWYHVKRLFSSKKK